MNWFLKLALALATLCPAWAWSACPPHTMAGPGQVRLKSEAVLIVVHPTSTYDARYASKRGIDEAVRFAKVQKMPVIYLQDDSPEEFYFPQDCAPDHWVYSDEGELNFEVAPAHVYVAGGHLEMCLSTALNEILYQWAKKAPRNLKITFFMDGIYSNGKVIDP